MKGCLVTLALLTVIAIGAIWFVLPPVAGTLTQGALVAAGFNADAMTVTVVADPPPRLLGLRADEMRIQATNATYRGLTAVDVDLTLHDVRLADRTFGSLDGTLRDVTTASGASGEVTIPLAVLSGTADRIQVTLVGPLRLKFESRLHRVGGTFHVAVSDTTVGGATGGVFYHLEADYVQ